MSDTLARIRRLELWAWGAGSPPAHLPALPDLGMTPSLTNAGKPDDIQQDVWNEALRLWQDEEADPGEVIIARAIMAAKAEEREANEAVCVERAARHKAAVSQYPDDEQSRVLCLDSALEAMECAAAIRKRGGQ